MAQSIRKPADEACTVCGRPIGVCTVGGPHGVIRDKALRAATRVQPRG